MNKLRSQNSARDCSSSAILPPYRDLRSAFMIDVLELRDFAQPEQYVHAAI